jgi:hypothetical protein
MHALVIDASIPMQFIACMAGGTALSLSLRASSIVEGPKAEIRRYLAPDGCKFRSGKACVSSGEPRAFFEFKVEVDKMR